MPKVRGIDVIEAVDGTVKEEIRRLSPDNQTATAMIVVRVLVNGKNQRRVFSAFGASPAEALDAARQKAHELATKPGSKDNG